jgi:hypothetical protein
MVFALAALTATVYFSNSDCSGLPRPGSRATTVYVQCGLALQACDADEPPLRCNNNEEYTTCVKGLWLPTNCLFGTHCAEGVEGPLCRSYG